MIKRCMMSATKNYRKIAVPFVFLVLLSCESLNNPFDANNPNHVGDDVLRDYLSGDSSRGSTPPFFGNLTDSRDGQSYRTILTGGRVWMAQNLNYATDSSWCYDDDDSRCVEYGRLYGWTSATSACPSGWHLPDTADWNHLVKTAGGNETAGENLKSKTGWHSNNGPDKLGFAALPAGYRFDASIYNNAAISATWWSGGAGESDPLAPTQSIYDYRNSTYANHAEKCFGFSIRCVKN